MKKIRFLSLVVVSVFALAGIGCENKEAVKALQDLTAKLAGEVQGNNDTLAGLAKKFDVCNAALARVRRQPAPAPETGTLEAPVLGEKIKMSTLKEYEKALNATLEKQKARIEELIAAGKTCAKDLAAARKKTVAVAKKKASTETQKAAEQKLQEEGRPTTGVGSRYKPRTQ